MYNSGVYHGCKKGCNVALNKNQTRGFSNGRETFKPLYSHSKLKPSMRTAISLLVLLTEISGASERAPDRVLAKVCENFIGNHSNGCPGLLARRNDLPLWHQESVAEKRVAWPKFD